MAFICRGCGVDSPGSDTRSFCSNACQRAREQVVLTEHWLSTGEAFIGTRKNHYVRLHLLREQSDRCAMCDGEAEWQGKELVLVIDHVDGNAENNHRENLRLVCPNCDSQLPTYKSRNRGRGRHARRERYAAGKSF